MFCPNCGVEVAEGANFCSKCGAQVAQTPTPAGTPGQPPRTEVKPAPAVSRLDEGGWARIVFSLGMLGLLFIAFTNFGGPVQAFLSSLATRVYVYGAAKPVLGILFGGGMVALAFIFKEQMKNLLSDLEVMLVGGGIALAGILMLITGGMSGLGWFIFQVLIGAVLGGVGFMLLKISTIFTDNKLEAISSKVVPFALFVFAAFTIVSGVGTLLSLDFLVYDLPQVFLIISSITGLLGVLGFAGATVLRLLGFEPGR